MWCATLTKTLCGLCRNRGGLKANRKEGESACAEACAVDRAYSLFVLLDRWSGGVCAFCISLNLSRVQKETMVDGIDAKLKPSEMESWNSGGTAHELPAERAQASFDVEKMT